MTIYASKNRVVITGIGINCCLGRCFDSVGNSLLNNESGIIVNNGWAEQGITSLVSGPPFDPQSFSEYEEIPKRVIKGMSEASVLMAISAIRALADAKLDSFEDVYDPLRFGCVLSSGIPSVPAMYESTHLFKLGKLRKADPMSMLRSMASSATAGITSHLKIKGRSYTVGGACASSTHAIGHGAELIRDGKLDAILVGGGDPGDILQSAGFQTQRITLSKKYNKTPKEASRPFDDSRDGFVLGGGAGILVLENETTAKSRGAKIYGEVLGYGASSDGYNLMRPHPNGEGAANAMKIALDDANIDSKDIDYINAHGTGTYHGDISEIAAMKQCFSDIPYFSSTKSLTGHAVSGAGALEVIYGLCMMDKDFIAASNNIEKLMPEAKGLNIVNTVIKGVNLKTVMSNNFGFGGSNASIIFTQYD